MSKKILLVEDEAILAMAEAKILKEQELPGIGNREKHRRGRPAERKRAGRRPRDSGTEELQRSTRFPWPEGLRPREGAHFKRKLTPYSKTVSATSEWLKEINNHDPSDSYGIQGLCLEKLAFSRKDGAGKRKKQVLCSH